MSDKTTPQSDWWVDFMNANPVPQASLDHFARIPWTNKYLTNPAYQPMPIFSRTAKPTGEDYFFSTTVSTADTLAHFICLQRRDYNSVAQVKNLQNQKYTPEVKNAPAPEEPDCFFLISVGKSGLDGHGGVLHGGMCCAILDETMGEALVHHLHEIEGAVRQSHLFTAYLNVNYRAPVVTPGEIVVTAWLTHQQDRKWYVRGQILDRNGKVCTEGEGLWIGVPAQRL